MIPYLKGFHLTIEMWRAGRDSEGWKLRDGEVNAIAQDQSLDSWTELDNPLSAQTEDEDMAGVNHRIGVKRGNVGVHTPADGFTTLVPRFKKDIVALMRLTDFDLPPPASGETHPGGAGFLRFWRRVGKTIWGHSLGELQLLRTSDRSSTGLGLGTISDWIVDSGGGGRELKLQGA